MAESFLRLRHRLIPYLYTMNHRAWAQGQPLCQPMYYLEPENPAAYAVPNAYTFGTQLLCAPITRPAPAGSPASGAQVYLPEGGWTDIFTGVRYSGGRTLAMYRDIRSFPVLAPDGAILPLDDCPERAAQGNPECLTVRVYPGANGAFTLYEDDNETTAYRRGDCALTDLVYTDGAQPSLRIAAHGQLDLLPAERRFTVELIGLCTDICVVSNALILKANFPEMEITVDSSCCAGVTKETHEAALATMRCCQIHVR